MNTVIPGNEYCLVRQIAIANYPGAKWLPTMFGQTGAPPAVPDDLLYVTTQPDTTDWPFDSTHFTCFMPTWSNDFPMDCYVTAIWLMPDKYGSQDPNDTQFTDIPGTFTWTGNNLPPPPIPVEFTIVGHLPATGGTVTLVAQTNDFTQVTGSIGWGAGSTSGGALSWALIDPWDISATFDDFTQFGFDTGTTVTIYLYDQYNQEIGQQDTVLSYGTLPGTVTLAATSSLTLATTTTPGPKVTMAASAGLMMAATTAPPPPIFTATPTTMPMGGGTMTLTATGGNDFNAVNWVGYSSTPDDTGSKGAMVSWQYIDTTHITCVLPNLGYTTTLWVEVEGLGWNEAFSVNQVAVTSDAVKLSSISPTIGQEGDALTLTGTGFLSLPLDAGGKPLVYFLSGYGYPETSPDDVTVVEVNDTTITCIIPYLDPFYDTPNTYYVGLLSAQWDGVGPPPVIPSPQPLIPTAFTVSPTTMSAAAGGTFTLSANLNVGNFTQVTDVQWIGVSVSGEGAPSNWTLVNPTTITASFNNLHILSPGAVIALQVTISGQTIIGEPYVILT
jgi:hypothetical protein